MSKCPECDALRKRAEREHALLVRKAEAFDTLERYVGFQRSAIDKHGKRIAREVVRVIDGTRAAIAKELEHVE